MNKEDFSKVLDEAFVDYMYNRVTAGGKMVEVKNLDKQEIEELKKQLLKEVQDNES
jgi:DNA primase large subunit